MKNPFLEPGLILLDQERKRRERFKISVYASLAALAVLLSGMLIQGCQQSRKADAAAEPGAGNPPELSSNLPAATSRPTDTNGPMISNLTANPLPPAEPAPTAPAPAAVPAVAPAATSSSVQASPAPTPIPSAKDVIYVVKSGDNLTHIARKHGTTLQAIRSSNHLKTDRLVVGQKLKLPAVPAS